MPDLADQELISKVLDEDGGDSEWAFRQLIERYQDRLTGLLLRFTRDRYAVEDLLQEVFLKVYRKLHTFNSDSAFYTWLYRIAVNAANDHLDSRRRRKLQLVQENDMLEADGPQPGHAGAAEPLLEEEQRQVTRDILADLPEKYRTILLLREYEDMAYTRMAEVLGCSIGTVESRLFRARKRFKEALERLHPEHVPGARTDTTQPSSRG